MQRGLVCDESLLRSARVGFEFKPSSASDAPAIAALCSRVLPVPPASRVFSPEQLQWKYWDPSPLWHGSRSFMLLAGTELIAHAGVVPLRFCRDGRSYTLVQLIDWAAEPKHVGAGVALLKRITALADGAVSVRGSTMTQRILKPVGFRALPPTQQYVAGVNAGAREPRSELGSSVEVRVHRAGSFAAREHPLCDAQSSDTRVVFQRTAAQVQAWLACPVAPMEYVELLQGAQLLGSFIVCHTPGQARIADAWADDGVPGAWEAVIERAYLHACEQTDASEVVCQSNDPAQQCALLRSGFQPAGSDPLAILASPALVPGTALVPHHLLDSDLAYLHHGQLQSWLS